MSPQPTETEQAERRREDRDVVNRGGKVRPNPASRHELIGWIQDVSASGVGFRCRAGLPDTVLVEFDGTMRKCVVRRRHKIEAGWCDYGAEFLAEDDRANSSRALHDLTIRLREMEPKIRAIGTMSALADIRDYLVPRLNRSRLWISGAAAFLCMLIAASAVGLLPGRLLPGLLGFGVICLIASLAMRMRVAKLEHDARDARSQVTGENDAS